MIYLPLIPKRASLSGHQTFAIRSGWLKKGVDALVDHPDAFVREDAMVTLGVGKNMVQSIRHWLLTTGMAELDGRNLTATPIARSLFNDEAGWDPYLEDDATLWLLHWQLTSSASLSLSWICAFHALPSAGFTRQSLTEAVQSAAIHLPKEPGAETVFRDIDCFLHTYVVPDRAETSLDTLDCPLQSLGLIRIVDSGKGGDERRYRFQIGPKQTLPPAVFFHALMDYWRWREAGSYLTVVDIAHGPGSPGRAFKLDEDSILEYLDVVEDISAGGLRFDDAALTRQVVLPDQSHAALRRPSYFLETYYSHV